MEQLSANIADRERILSRLICEGVEASALSLRGLSHIAQGMPCQDSHCLMELPGGWILAAVADGVGSEKNSDQGAALAVKAASDFVKNNLGYFVDRASMLNLLRCAFQFAAGEITALANVSGEPVHSYSTTLHMVLFAGGMVFFGHAGDGGILAMETDGTFLPLTQPQKGPDGESVLPLMAGPACWQFSCTEQPVQSVLLCTDGVWNKLCSKVLQNHGFPVDPVLGLFFLSPWTQDNETPQVIATEAMVKAMRSGTPNDFYPLLTNAVAQGGNKDEAQDFVLRSLWQNDRPRQTLMDIQDDVTVAVIQQTAVTPIRRPLSDFTPPDWDAIHRDLYQTLYGKPYTVCKDNPQTKEDQPE